MAGIFDDMPGVRREAVPGPDGYSGCSVEKPSWTKPVVQFKDSLDEHRDFRIKTWQCRIVKSASMVEEIAIIFTDLHDKVDVLEMELNRLKRAGEAKR